MTQRSARGERECGGEVLVVEAPLTLTLSPRGEGTWRRGQPGGEGKRRRGCLWWNPLPGALTRGAGSGTLGTGRWLDPGIGQWRWDARAGSASQAEDPIPRYPCSRHPGRAASVGCRALPGAGPLIFARGWALAWRKVCGVRRAEGQQDGSRTWDQRGVGDKPSSSSPVRAVWH